MKNLDQFSFSNTTTNVAEDVKSSNPSVAGMDLFGGNTATSEVLVEESPKPSIHNKVPSTKINQEVKKEVVSDKTVTEPISKPPVSKITRVSSQRYSTTPKVPNEQVVSKALDLLSSPKDNIVDFPKDRIQSVEEFSSVSVQESPKHTEDVKPSESSKRVEEVKRFENEVKPPSIDPSILDVLSDEPVSNVKKVEDQFESIPTPKVAKIPKPNSSKEALLRTKAVFSDFEYDAQFKKLEKSFREGEFLLAGDFECYYRNKKLMLVGYRGNDIITELPSYAANVPITYVGTNVFASVESDKLGRLGKLAINYDAKPTFSETESADLHLPITLLTIPNKFFVQFGQCKRVIIPPTVKELGSSAFHKAMIDEIYFTGNVPRNFHLLVFPKDSKIFVPKKYAKNYLAVLMKGGN